MLLLTYKNKSPTITFIRGTIIACYISLLLLSCGLSDESDENGGFSRPDPVLCEDKHPAISPNNEDVAFIRYPGGADTSIIGGIYLVNIYSLNVELVLKDYYCYVAWGDSATLYLSDPASYGKGIIKYSFTSNRIDTLSDQPGKSISYYNNSIVFEYGSEIWMYDIVYNRVSRVAYSGKYRTPSWSSDGTYILASMHVPNNTSAVAIVLLATTGTIIDQVNEPRRDHSYLYPKVNNDGDHILCEHGYPTNNGYIYDVVEVNMASGSSTTIVRGRYPIYNDSNNVIIYSYHTDVFSDGLRLYMINTENNEIVQLTF